MDKALILKRIKEEKNFKTDSQLAVFLGISKAVLSNWKKRDTIDYDLVLSKCEHLDLNLIIRGEIFKGGVAPEIHIVDNNSMGFILDRYEALAFENGLQKKEIEELKRSRNNYIDGKKDLPMAAEPDPPPYTP